MIRPELSLSLSLSGLEQQPAAIEDDENGTCFSSPGKQARKSQSFRFGSFRRSTSNTFDDDPEASPAPSVSRTQNTTFEQDSMTPRTRRQQKMRANIEKRKNHIKIKREQKQWEQERAAAQARTVGDPNSQSMLARLKRKLPSRKSKRLVAASGLSIGMNSISSEERSPREC